MCASSQDSAPFPASAVTNGDAVVVFDSSYSMGLPAEGSATRLDLLQAELERLVSGSEDRYAFLFFDSEGSITLQLPYPASGQEVADAAGELLPWGTSPVLDAARTGIDYASRLLDTPATVVLFTDGEDSTDYLSASASASAAAGEEPTGNAVPSELSDGSVQLVVVTLDESAPGFSPALARWVSESGGRIVSLAPDAGAVRSVSPSASLGRAALGHEFGPDRAAPAPAEPTRGPFLRFLSAWLLVVRWNMAASAVLGVAVLVLLVLRYRKRRDRVERHNSSPPTVTLEVRTTISRQTHQFAEFPLTVGTRPGCTLPLENGKAEGQQFKLELVGGEVHYSSDHKLNVNGVPRSSWQLSPDDQIRLGRFRIFLRGVETTTPLPLPPRTHYRFIPLPAFAAAAAILLFLFQPLPLLPGTDAGRGEDARALIAGRTSDGVAADADALGFEGPESLPPSMTLPAIYSRGEDIEFFDADYIVVHAHPDDETLDHGVLIARLSDAGLRGAVILFTDGQSGRDQYPERGVDDLYPPYDLRGPELARLRVREASRALARLGVEAYVRGELPNHPYNSITDELSVGQVISRWGGLNSIVDNLAEVVSGFSPEIVLSPDVQRGPYEHFEHEAVGLIVRELTRRLSVDADGTVRAHLVGVDPLQTEHYDWLLEIDPWGEGRRSGTSFRATQLRALLEHRTQRDASTIGVESRLAVDAEYYAIAYWDPGFRPPAAIGTSLSGQDLAARTLAP